MADVAVADRWLTAADAAHYLSVSVTTLSKWRAAGIGPQYSAALGRDPRYRMSDLEAFMDSKMATNTREAKTLRHTSTRERYTGNVSRVALSGGA